jgi:hypothetical protein
MYVGLGIHYKLERQSQIVVNNSFLHVPINLLGMIGYEIYFNC